MIESYRDYTLVALPKKTKKNKWKVGVKVKRTVGEEDKEIYYKANDGIEYILEVEAAKESINLGKNLIKNHIVRF